ncbi:MAG: PEP-CTERM sorting domain-containing protein [Pirellulales bacterium]|nr:PEP-CTERM sorting domain-containing protein [Pirellulales bacterium]
MSSYQRFSLVLIGALLFSFCFAPLAVAQITGVVSSDVEGFFGSQNDTFQQSEPPIGPTWPANVNGPYPITGPTVPALYAGYPNPSLTYTSNIPYDLGHIGPGFADTQLTTANYSLLGNYSGGANTGDAFAVISGPPMSLVQPATATGFAYQKVEFAMTYSVGPSGILAGAAPAYPLLVTGNVLPGGYAQFGAQVDYWWIPVIPGTIIPSGPSVNLGTLQYSFLQPGGGSFNTVVNHSPTVLAGATGVGFLQITGEMFVAGDPFEIYVTSVPEPSTFALAGIAAVALLATGRRHRRRKL